MWNWKLLGDLDPNELKLECERANLVGSDKAFHNCIKLSKYILNNGYDPETFYFNTHYKADKTNPLVGMAVPTGQLCAARNAPSSRTNVTSAKVKTASCSVSNPVTANTTPQNSADRMLDSILGLVQTLSSDVKQLLAIKEQDKPRCQGKPSSGLSEDSFEDGTSLPSLPFWDSLESVPSSRSSLGTSAYSFGSRLTTHRKYDKNLLISSSICIAFQHGTCPYGEEADSHVNRNGEKVIHYCGLCETDSPDNQCYSPAYKCPGPYFNS